MYYASKICVKEKKKQEGKKKKQINKKVRLYLLQKRLFVLPLNK
jgi:hypothetical protein